MSNLPNLVTITNYRTTVDKLCVQKFNRPLRIGIKFNFKLKLIDLMT